MVLGFIYKVDFFDAYMCIWDCTEDIPSVEFWIPRKYPYEKHLVGFHLSIPIGYIDSANLFLTATNMAKDWAIGALLTWQESQ